MLLMRRRSGCMKTTWGNSSQIQWRRVCLCLLALWCAVGCGGGSSTSTPTSTPTPPPATASTTPPNITGQWDFYESGNHLFVNLAQNGETLTATAAADGV